MTETPRIATLSIVEFVGATTVGETATTAERWIHGPSEPATRLRRRVTATGDEGFAAAVVCGEPGSGRLRVARCLHAASRRADAPLAVIDGGDPGASGALASILEGLQSQTGPGNVVLRAVERASGETIGAAVELLTGQGLQLRCGIIVVTHEPPAALRARSLQHGQLFARCGRAIIQVPRLAARLADVPVLAKRFLAEAVQRYAKPIRGISPQAMAALQRHDYPGNVRELSGLVEQAVLAGGSDWLTAEDFPRLAHNQPTPSRRGELTIRMPGNSLREIELQALRLALELTDGRIVRAAELLGITRHALRRKLEKHGLNELRRAPPSGGDDDDGDAFI